jgi:hypothetical protein
MFPSGPERSTGGPLFRDPALCGAEHSAENGRCSTTPHWRPITYYRGRSYSVNKPGLDVGAGVAFGSKWGGRFFAEARYVHIYSGAGYHTDCPPVTFGFRR